MVLQMYHHIALPKVFHRFARTSWGNRKGIQVSTWCCPDFGSFIGTCAQYNGGMSLVFSMLLNRSLEVFPGYRPDVPAEAFRERGRPVRPGDPDLGISAKGVLRIIGNLEGPQIRVPSIVVVQSI